MKREESKMKNLIKLLSRLVLLCVFLFSGFAIVKAASSTKQNFLESIVKQENSLERIKVFSEHAKIVSLEKFRSRTTTSKKVNFSREKKLKKAEKKGAYSCLLSSALTGGCFTNCLSRYVSPDLVATCATACSGGDLGGCGSCLGLAAVIVGYCAIECSGGGGGEYIPVEPPQSKNIKHKHRNNGERTRRDVQIVSR